MVKKQKTADTSFKPNSMDRAMDIEKLNELQSWLTKVWIVKKGDITELRYI